MARNNTGEAQRIRREKDIFDTAREMLIGYARCGKITTPMQVEEIYDSAVILHNKFRDKLEESEDWVDE